MAARPAAPMRGRALVASGLALGAAAALYLWVAPQRAAFRLSNLDLERSAFRDTFVMHSHSEPDRCFVVGRRSSSQRRDDRGQPGRKWRCASFALEGAARPAWLVRSKRVGKGTVFFVPASAVPDWSYPYLYGFVRALRPDPTLPEVEWTQLHIDRIYRGLYLRVALPFDRRKKDGGSGVLREVLVVEDDRLAAFDTRFREARTLYSGAIADGRFPELVEPDPALAWLARRAPGAHTTFLLGSQAPARVELLPLPVSLARLHSGLRGRPAPQFADARHAGWTQGAWRRSGGGDAGDSPFDPEQRAALVAGYADYERALEEALRLDRQSRGESRAPLRVADRRAAAADLLEGARP